MAMTDSPRFDQRPDAERSFRPLTIGAVARGAGQGRPDRAARLEALRRELRSHKLANLSEVPQKRLRRAI